MLWSDWTTGRGCVQGSGIALLFQILIVGRKDNSTQCTLASTHLYFGEWGNLGGPYWGKKRLCCPTSLTRRMGTQFEVSRESRSTVGGKNDFWHFWTTLHAPKSLKAANLKENECFGLFFFTGENAFPLEVIAQTIGQNSGARDQLERFRKQVQQQCSFILEYLENTLPRHTRLSLILNF